MPKRIKTVKVQRLALCKRAVNGLSTIYKADGSFEWSSLTKSDAEKGELLAIGYAPNMLDGEGHFADAATIEEMARTFLEEGATLEFEHFGDALSKSAASAIESFIVQPTDPRFHDWKDYEGNALPKGALDGAWAVRLQLKDQVLRDAFRSGELDGVSLFGKAALERDDPVAAGQRVSERLSKSNSMTPEQLKALTDALAASNTAAITALGETLAKALKPAEPKAAAEGEDANKPKPEAAPVFEGDPSKPEDLQAFAKSMAAFELRRDIAAGKLTAAQILAKSKALAEGEPSDEEADIQADDSPEVAGLKRQLAKAMRQSNAPEGTSKVLSKEETLAKSRKELADLIKSEHKKVRASKTAPAGSR